ncbi:ABC transporter substrate-binding protein [Phytohabitans rumicis]|uniref:ABC transporter substrate-binding protein n=1 Tax=Phytohabitans rumicis TaxID=1076125 RepID=UPI001FE44577|nr:extracellular solute-binding protein [Phytohabitans rumicis]
MPLSAALAACGGGGDDNNDTAPTGPVSQADIDKAMSTPTELTFWTWVPDIQQEVDLFLKKYPSIKVKIVNAGRGTEQYTKLRTALKAGTGAPDVVQMEFQYIPTFTITGDLLDLRPYGAEALKDQFVDWTWGQVTGRNGEVWAIPQDTGPMGMLYRQDIFDKHGIAVPKTWDEFAAAARKLHTADPNVYLTCLSANEAAAWHGLLWQAGAAPYAVSGASDISLKVNDEAAKNLARYWGGLAKEGVIGTEPNFTDAWFNALNRGKYATWLTAAWGPSSSPAPPSRRRANGGRRRCRSGTRRSRPPATGAARRARSSRRRRTRLWPPSSPSSSTATRKARSCSPPSSSSSRRPRRCRPTPATWATRPPSTAVRRSTRSSRTSTRRSTCLSSGRRSWTGR